MCIKPTIYILKCVLNPLNPLNPLNIGLVTKPYQEGKKAGALGFVKGIGMGLVGVATRPVLGITDGISNVAGRCHMSYAHMPICQYVIVIELDKMHVIVFLSIFYDMICQGPNLDF
jgi:hypothetical protein